MLKSVYVKFMRAIGAVLDFLGVLAWLERRSSSRWAHWLRSLFAIYDIDQLTALDVPWWTYDSIDAVEAYLAGRENTRAFEYGSGASTVWLSQRVSSLKSVEHDADWFPIVQERLAGLDNAAVSLVERDLQPAADDTYRSEKSHTSGQTFQAYASAIEREEGLFDLIVIDGRARPACLKHAVYRLAPDGMIVFDNSRRARYAHAIDASGLAKEVYTGLVPSLPYPDQTTLLRHKA